MSIYSTMVLEFSIISKGRGVDIMGQFYLSMANYIHSFIVKGEIKQVFNP